LTSVKTNTVKKILVLCLLASLTYGCKKVDSNDLKDTVPYYQSYGVYYDKDENKTEASATFRVRDANGTRVELSNGANVMANGIAATTHFLSPTDYKWAFIGMQDVAFVLNKNSGTAINNKALRTDISNIDFAANFPASASKAAGFSFGWTGTPLENGESMMITISTPDSASTRTKAMNATNSSQTINFSSTEMQNMVTGTMTVEMVRYKSKALDNNDGTSTGSIALRYRLSKKMPLNP